jgi:hypothetical protein
MICLDTEKMVMEWKREVKNATQEIYKIQFLTEHLASLNHWRMSY